MAQIALIAAGAGQAIKAYQTKKYKDAEAAGHRQAAKRSMAASTRDMAEEQRRKEMIHSRAIAVAAASGAGVDDPSMVNLLGDLNAEGEYRVMSRLWQGQNDAEGHIYRAEAAKREGKMALIAGGINTVNSVFSAYSSMGGSFGGKTAPQSPGTKIETKPVGVPA